MKILILGHAQHGKTTLANLLKEIHGLKFSDSSLFCAEKIVMPWLEEKGIAVYDSVEACHEDRGNFRPEWHQAIWEYNQEDPTRLARELLAENDVYCGMRKWEEFAPSIEQGVFDRVIWIEAPCVEKESVNSFNIDKKKASLKCREEKIIFYKLPFWIKTDGYEKAVWQLQRFVKKMKF